MPECYTEASGSPETCSSRGPGSMPYLEVKSPQGQRRLELGLNVLTVGRLPDNGLVIADEKASRHHCVIEPFDGGFNGIDEDPLAGIRDRFAW